jgi:protein-S-isoprenylcysteine O-methyltransferase Ste14
MAMQFREIVYSGLAAGWIVFLIAMFKARPWTRIHDLGGRPPEAKWGTALIVAGLAILLIPYSPAGTRIALSSFEFSLGLTALSCLISLFAMIAMRGARWLPEEAMRPHLLRTGILGIVRHPVYTALIVQALATALAISWWLWMFAGMFFVILGVDLRAAADDLILSDLFQEEFIEYQAGSKSYLPWLH